MALVCSTFYTGPMVLSPILYINLSSEPKSN